MTYYVIFLLAHISISWILANYFQEVAEMKGHDEKRYFWLPFLFSVVGYLLVIALPDREEWINFLKEMFVQ